MDVLGYSLNSLRLANLNFVDAESTRCSQLVRLKMNPDETHRLLQGRLGLSYDFVMSEDHVNERLQIERDSTVWSHSSCWFDAAHSSKGLTVDQRHKYGVVTLIDCRSLLDPVLNSHHLGFYHSGVMNTHDVSGGDKLWELAKRCYLAFSNAKNNNKHFIDMSDLNFLMCKAIDNPGLTPSSALRTACISVFEDPVIDDSNETYGELGVEDYVGCASVHGVGPSIAVFDTIRDGSLDSACVYPSPLHSRDQMQKFIDDMKRILVDSCVNMEEGEN
ncbi:hypothetical protein GH714_038185 [Hevea brasiliensis]|uniref:Choline/carnitine acyltransferase domain-containing protein n=1 Tax=Hevea brasiliensis TaxID=3981 RepID=A0A6A6KLS4_HEVBR|nr:hypothetical protein GH714_038185 [Hevea brasiliensis]